MHLTTNRLVIRPFTLADAPFIVELLNDPDWLRFIGDRNVRTIDDAERYLADGPIAMLSREGFALCAVIEQTTGESVGMCGLIKRAGLDDVDIGYAFLPRGRGHGYAVEAARATLDFAFGPADLPRVVAILDRANEASCRVLDRIGMRLEGEVTLPNSKQAPDAKPLLLYAAHRVRAVLPQAD